MIFKKKTSLTTSFNNIQSFLAIGMVALAWSSLVFCGEIHHAVRSGDLERVKTLLKDHPELTFSIDENGDTPLHLAAFYRNRDVVEVLLANGADVTAKDSTGLTPLHMVVVNGIRPRHRADDQGPKDVMEALLANGADVNAKDSTGLTPLHMAERKDLVELLLVHNANVDAQDNDGQTPLFAAAEKGADAAVELLLAHKADPCPGRLRPDECLQTRVARPDQLGNSRPRFWVPFPEIRDWNSLRVTLRVIGTYWPESTKTEITGDGTVLIDRDSKTHIPRLVVKALFNQFRALYKTTPGGPEDISPFAHHAPIVMTAITFDGHAKFEHVSYDGFTNSNPLPEAVELAARGKLWPRSIASICGWCVAFTAPALIIGLLSRYVLYRLRISLLVKRLVFILVNTCFVAPLPLLATSMFFLPAPNLFAIPWDARLYLYAAVLILMTPLYAVGSMFLIRANVGSEPARDRGAISS
jgi:Ankyrin repeats (3 copies)